MSIYDKPEPEIFKAANDWWSGTLSINEQRAFAAKHLEDYRARYITTETKWVSKNYYQQLIILVWEAEGKPKAIVL